MNLRVIHFAFAAIVTPILTSVPATAQTMYKCRDSNGSVIFSDVECGHNQETLKSGPSRSAIPAPSSSGTAPKKRDLRMDLGGGDAVVLAGGEGQFWCDDPKYAGKEIRVTWTVQSKSGIPSLCELVPWADTVMKLLHAGNSALAVTRIQSASSVDDLRALETALASANLTGKWAEVDAAIARRLQALSPSTRRRQP
jgi:hypothetical protein